jgi:hypothetical protein
MEPYLRGDVSPIMDISSESIELGLRISKLRESMCNLHSLQMKLKVPEDEPLQTNIKASLLWSEKEIFEYNEGFIPALPERLSFAAYQTVSGDNRSLSPKYIACNVEFCFLFEISISMRYANLSWNDQQKQMLRTVCAAASCSPMILLPPFHIIRLFSIVYIHIYVNESRHICVPKFINVYMNVGNARKSYNLKRR